jgi:hypothetical protein
MDERIPRLEVEFECIRKDLDEIRADQKQTLTALAELPGEFRSEIARRPTTIQFWGLVGSVAVIAFTVVLVILSGLAYLRI